MSKKDVNPMESEGTTGATEFGESMDRDKEE